MECLVVGHLVIDRIVRDGRSETRIGGGAYYSALALSRFCRVKVVTSVGRDFPREWLEGLRERGISLEVVPSEESTSYELHYIDGNRRVLTLLSRAEPIENVTAGDFDLILLNPVAGEVSPELVRELAGRGFLAADVQGFIREPVPGPLRLKTIDGTFLRGMNVLHSDVGEFKHVRGINPSDVEVLLLSDGPNPGTAYFKGREYRFKPVKMDVPESTGAGDVFLASFSYFYLRCPFVQALKRATAFTALFLKRRDFDAEDEEIGRMAMRVSVEKVSSQGL
ncbi:carbohydrate kinase [Thermococcus sp. AM4]|uniref:carbohydrate kinase n=1 Tax=Thermococcus sp. (strain AM4) TaxID=246969 RepID=UPI0001870F51|nr:carbohydrate kinase [Thermococcus sp. AM4]EEB73912.1 carbohydrate/pyrimidine kinase, PfkB family [Thermococcus sp. AM4]